MTARRPSSESRSDAWHPLETEAARAKRDLEAVAADEEQERAETGRDADTEERPPSRRARNEMRKAEEDNKRRKLEDVILELCAAQPAGKSIDPIAAAKAFAEARGEDDLAWRHWLTHVRAAAVGLARKGQLVIYRKGKPADPDDFRGVYRLGLPHSG